MKRNLTMGLHENKKPVVPLHVYMTWKTKKLPPFMQANFNQLKSKNPQFTFHLYDDADCRTMIQHFFPKEVVDAFDTLKPGAYKADLWRLCVLYLKGGIYMDCKLQPINNFTLFEIVGREHFVLDRPPGCIYNALMVCKAGNPILKEGIEQIVKNVKDRYYGICPLSPTGPEMLGRVASKYKLTFAIKYPYHYPEHIMYENRLILRNYPEYRKEQTSKDYYGILWNKKNIYYEYG
jgi:mannosyltransferase OCH1-like enzyme